MISLGSGGDIEIHAGLVRKEDIPKPASPPEPAPRQEAEPVGTAQEEAARNANGSAPTIEAGPEATAASDAGDAAPAAEAVVHQPQIRAPMFDDPEVGKQVDPETKAKKEAGVSASLFEDLRAVRTEAIRERLANSPEAAFDLLLFNLAGSVLTERYHEKALNITAQAKDSYPYRADAKPVIHEALGNRATWQNDLNLPLDYKRAKSRRRQFEQLSAMPQEDKMRLLAGCVAKCLNGQLAFEPNALPDVESTVERLGIDFSKATRPTLALYWSRVTKDRLLKIAQETLGADWAAAHKSDNKPDLAAAVDEAFRMGDTPVGVQPKAHEAAVAWAMPGFRPFDSRSNPDEAPAEETNQAGGSHHGCRRRAEPARQRDARRGGRHRGAPREHGRPCADAGERDAAPVHGVAFRGTAPQYQRGRRQSPAALFLLFNTRRFTPGSSSLTGADGYTLPAG